MSNITAWGRGIGPKTGDILYYIQPDVHQLAWMGVAYEVAEDVTTAKVVATAVSGSEAKVRSMLKAKLKKKGIEA